MAKSLMQSEIMRKSFKLISTFFLSMFVSLTCMAQSATASIAGSGPQGIGLMANNMMEPVGMAKSVFSASSMLLGVYLIIASYARYRRFKQNPQESRLSTLLFWCILGIILIALPFTYQLARMAAQNTGAGDVAP